MKPAGPERDRQVAELRGDEWLLECIIGCETVFQMDEAKAKEQKECPACGEEVRAYPKPYSTDISAAMELWEEMKAAAINMRLEPECIEGKQVYVEFAWAGGSIDYEGKTEADAISGAWLKWREG